jgi:mono/diheme cytochrome c family protein
VKRLVRILVGAFALVGALAVAAALAFAWSGVSARRAPSAFEAWAARSARQLLIPASARRSTNPLVVDPELLEHAEDHFVDHCAPCHGVDGKGDTPLGRGLNPRVPDLTLPATQGLSDGELFWIIEHGIRLTGMPAFGKASEDDDEHAWSLVHWIRRLPELTPEEIERMEHAGGAHAAERVHHSHSHTHP